MPDGTQFDFTSLKEDATFRGMSMPQRVAYLSAVDPTFSKFNPQQQAGYINHVMGNDQPTQFEQEKTGGPRGVLNALKGMVPPDPTEGRSPLDPKFWLNTDKARFDPTGKGTAYDELTRPLPKDLPTNALVTSGGTGQSNPVGRGIYRAASVFAPLAGGSAENMEAASGKADTSGVATQAAVPIATAVGVPLVKAGARALLAKGAPARAAGFYERTTAPGGAKAEGQLENRRTFEQASPYLAEQQRQTPVFNKQPKTVGSQPQSTAIAGQEMGVMNYRQNALAAGQKLWGDIEPRARMYETAPLEPTKAGVTARQAVSGTVNPTEAQLNPGKVAGVQSLADFTGKIGTVGEALDRIHELNNDKGVQAYEKALPDKQADLLKGDPTIEGKITAANTLRDQVFDSIEKHGNPEDASWIRGARDDYRAISEVATNLGNTNVPTPVPFLSRVGNSMRAVISPTSAREYLSKPVSTLLDLNNPNRLALKSSEALGQSNLQVPKPPPIRMTPWNPDVRPPGPIVGDAGQTLPQGTGGPRGSVFNPPPASQVPATGPGNNPAVFPDIPTGQAPETATAGQEVPNWPPKTPDWTPPNTAPPIPDANAAPGSQSPGGVYRPPGGAHPITPPSASFRTGTGVGADVAPQTQPPIPSSQGAPPPAPSASQAGPAQGGSQVPSTMPPVDLSKGPKDYVGPERRAAENRVIGSAVIDQLYDELRKATAPEDKARIQRNIDDLTEQKPQ